MATKYSDLIELSPGYESVVDTTIESRDRDFWLRYIVNSDMVNAVDTITNSLRREQDDAIRHFWLSGTYGTGKTYSAIVLKHLLTDPVESIKPFLDGNKLFADVKDKFLALRKKGPYCVIWKSGESQKLNTSDAFLMELERLVVAALKAAGVERLGSGALINEVKKQVKKFKASLKDSYDNGSYGAELVTYADFEQFYQDVQNGDVDACKIATQILRQEQISLAADKESFKAWLTEVYNENPNLKKTGIFIIWDEFTEYIRNAYDIELLQDLSEFAKTIPFYIMYVIHEYPNMVKSFDPSYMMKINARFHKITISLSDQTTNLLIGETLKIRAGKDGAWNKACDKLQESIQDRIYDFMDEDQSPRDLRKMFPIHPMTVALISKTAGSFAAANRSIFRFMKDEQAEEQGAGFRYFIRNFGPDGWRWATPDFLWDYFFVAETHDSQNREITPQAEECLKHYSLTEAKVSDAQNMRVYKCCMLLRATLGSGRSLKKTASTQGLKTTLSTLQKCFCGQIDPEAIAVILQGFADANILSVSQDRGDVRFDIPYAGTDNEFSPEFEKLSKINTYGTLLGANGVYGRLIKETFLPDARAIVRRFEVMPTYAQTNALNVNLTTLLDGVEKNPHKFGVLVVVGSTEEEVARAGEWAVAAVNKADDPRRKRIMVVVMKTLLTEAHRKDLLTCMVKASLAQRSGNATAARSESDAGEELVSKWIVQAQAKELQVFQAGSMTASKAFGNNAFVARAEKVVFDHFPNAPEVVCGLKTLYKGANVNSAKYGLWHLTSETKDSANKDHTGFNAQYQTIVDALKDVWDSPDVPGLLAAEGDCGRSCRPVLELCKFIDGKLKNSTSVDLPGLWNDLQSQFGYYNNILCAYLLGFAFRFYRDAPYSWWDGQNSHSFNDETIATMIGKLCTGRDLLGQRISIGNKDEKRFREQTATIFGLSEKDSGNEDQTRKNVRAKISRRGYPFWTLKYLPEDCYTEPKASVLDVVDKYESFTGNIGDQQRLMEFVVNRHFKGPQGRMLIAWLKKYYADEVNLNEGMKTFIEQNSPETAAACREYGFTMGQVFQMLRRELQEEVYQWTEGDVSTRLVLLGLDLRLVGVFKGVTKAEVSTIERVRELVANTLARLKVPGCIYEKQKVVWLPTFQRLVELSQNRWSGFTIPQKEETISLLQKNLLEVLRELKAPLEILGAYVESMGEDVSIEEQQQLLKSLNPDSHMQSEQNFQAAVLHLLSGMHYNKLKVSVLEKWREVSGDVSVLAWSDEHGIPALWLYPESEELFSTLVALEKGSRADIGAMEASEAELATKDFSALQDEARIDACLLEHVASASCRPLLADHIEDLKAFLKSEYPSSVWTYRLHLPEVQALVQKFVKKNLQKSVVSKVKTKISKMSADELRTALEKMLEANTELYIQML